MSLLLSKLHSPRHQWLMPVILATQEDLEASPGKKFTRPYLEKPFTKTELVEWLKVKVLSSNPSMAKKKKNLHFTLQSINL
jgi:hypothetical protein